jgi:hypothetical protein
MRPLRFFLVAAALAVGTSGLRATTVVPPEFPELVQDSDYVIRGRVVALRNEVRLRGGRELPFTLIDLEVRQVIVGTPPARVTLAMLGGTTSDGSELRVEGVPHFTVGQEDILFVQGNGTNFYPLHAVMHGRYPVKFDKKLNREYVARANGVPLSATAEVALPLAEGKLAQLLRKQIKPEDALSPAEFVQSIREARAAREQGGQRHAK